MKAFVMKEIGGVRFMEKPIPEAGPNDASFLFIKIRVIEY